MAWLILAVRKNGLVIILLLKLPSLNGTTNKTRSMLRWMPEWKGKCNKLSMISIKVCLNLTGGKIYSIWSWIRRAGNGDIWTEKGEDLPESLKKDNVLSVKWNVVGWATVLLANLRPLVPDPALLPLMLLVAIVLLLVIIDLPINVVIHLLLQ